MKRLLGHLRTFLEEQFRRFGLAGFLLRLAIMWVILYVKKVSSGEAFLIALVLSVCIRPKQRPQYKQKSTNKPIVIVPPDYSPQEREILERTAQTAQDAIDNEF